MKNYFMKTGMPGEQNLFNEGYRLEITHLPTGYSVAFSAFIDQMSDSYNANWASEQVFGRMDPIGTYERTKRNISVVWRVPASDVIMARDNLDKMNRLVSFLYPTYGNSMGATMMTQSPMWRVKFGNLICDARTGDGLLGWVRGITIDPALDEGIFTLDSKAQAANSAFGAGVDYFPKTVRLNIELAVVHEHDLGWENVGGTESGEEIFVFRGSGRESQSGQKEGMAFPYPSRRHVSDPIHEVSNNTKQGLIDLRKAFNSLLTRQDPMGNLVQLAVDAVSPTDVPDQDRTAQNAVLSAQTGGKK